MVRKHGGGDAIRKIGVPVSAGEHDAYGRMVGNAQWA